MFKLLKLFTLWIVSMFADGEFAIRFDRDHRYATAFSRGRMVRVRLVAGAAFGDLQASIPAAALAVSTTATTEVGVAPTQESQPSYVVSKLSLTTLTAVTGVGAAGAGATAQFRKTPAAGGAAVVMGSLQFNAGTNSVAETELNIPLSGVAGATTLNDGDVVDFQWVQGATGLALPASEAKVEFN